MPDKGQFPVCTTRIRGREKTAGVFIHQLWIFSFLKLLNDQYL
ncbi:hypothetical protein UNH65_08610 [Chitinophaga sp. 180180018-2]|nr:hypothetical protein [Chitinophaga sp. 212800010-3]